MSFDRNQAVIKKAETVSIPLEQGNVFRHEKLVEVLSRGFVSIPLEQGNVFRLGT